MNALNETIVAQLHEALRQAVADPEVRGIVIAGAGKAFIAGADIRFFVRNMDSGDIDRIVEFTEAGQALLNDIDRCPKPVVARLHGLALGGGLELALACDRLIATPKAAFAFPETGIGIYPGLGGTQRAPRRIGAPLAKWLIYTGQMLGAREAAEIGLIDRTVSLDTLDEAVHSEASGKKGDHDTIAGRPAMERLFGSHTVAALREGKIDAADNKEVARAIKQVGFKAPLALELAEKLIDGGAEIELDAGLQLELDQLRKIFSTEDAYEGLTSLGKRRPSFNGR
jgi:enoyl-CoA hydratase/3-hydroxyacyl-CoA dehydrogenase